MRHWPRSVIVVAGTAALVGFASPAPAVGGSSFSQLYQDYGSDGQIQNCDYSKGDLRNTAANIPPDVQAYDPGFSDSLNQALAAGCGGGSSPSTATAPPPPPAPGPTPAEIVKTDRKRVKHVAFDGSPKPSAPTKLPLPLSAPALTSDRGVPVAFLALAAAVGLLLISGVGIAVRRYFGWGLARPSRPAVGVAIGGRGRIGDALAGLRDRFRR